MSDWRDTFCGREAELRHLRECYDSVAAGDGLRIAVVLGERGMGKTRLVREFYSFLSAERDPDDYWPAAALFQGRNLLVGPDIERDAGVREHFASFALGERRMSFLWWSLRLTDPEDRNAAPTDLATHRRFLSLHLEPLRQAGRLADNRDALVEVGRDAAQGGLMKAMEMIPVVGAAIGLLFEGATLTRRVAKLSAERSAILEQQRSEQVARLARAGAADLVGSTLGELEALFSTASPSGGDAPARVPLVLFLDDAQFARPGGDEGVLRLVADLWLSANARGWPLLLIATHWAHEWWNADERATEPDFAGTFRPLLGALDGWHPLLLERERELEGLVDVGLPGLLRADVELILGRADGNPQLLIEIIDRVRRSPAWRTADGALSATGRKQLASAPFDLHHLIRQRLESDSTPEAVRRAVAMSSVQGLEFSCSLAEETGALLHAGPIRDGLVAAETTHRYISGVDRGVAGFLQRAYRDAALTLVDGQFGSEDEVNEAMSRAAGRFIDDAERWSALNDREQSAVLALRASLGEQSPDRSVRLEAARAMVASVQRALSEDAGAQDLPRASFWARRLSDGLLQDRWESADFAPDDLHSASLAARYWSGAGAALPLTNAFVQALRADLPGEPGLGEVLDLVNALWTQAEGLSLEGRFEEANAVNEEAMELARTLHERAPSLEAGTLLGGSLDRAASRMRIAGDGAEAERLLREWVALTHELADAYPEDEINAANRVLAMIGLAACLEQVEPSDEAVALLIAAYDAQHAIVARSLTFEGIRDLAAVLFSLGEASLRRGDPEAAAARFEQVVHAMRDLFTVEPRQEYRMVLCSVLSRTAALAWDHGDADAARRHNREARELLEAVSPAPDLSHAWHQLELYRSAAEYGQGELIAELFGEDDPGTAEGGVASGPGAAPLRGRASSPGASLHSLVLRARSLADRGEVLCWGYAELAGSWAAHRQSLVEAHGTEDAAPAQDVAMLFAQLREDLRRNGAGEALANWYQGGLITLEEIAKAARDSGRREVCVRAHERALRWCLDYVDTIGNEEAVHDLLYWCMLSGHEVLAMEGRIDPEVIRACGRVALGDPFEDEEEEMRVLRSPALSLLASLGADIPDTERLTLLHAAGAWFQRQYSPIAALAGYEAEIECGTIDPGAEERCETITTLAADALAQFPDVTARDASLEWRFLQRLRRKWHCGGTVDRAGTGNG